MKNVINRQSATKPLSIENIYEEGSTTILKRSTEDIYPWEKPDNVFYEFNSSHDLPKISCVYVIINKLNNKFYIGSTKSFNRRFTKHKSELKHQKHCSNKLQNAFDKYGIDNFKMVILEITENYAEKEAEYITKYEADIKGYNTVNFENKYVTLNLTTEQRKKSDISNSKAVIQLDLEGNYKNRFNSIIDACVFLGHENTTNISQVCLGKTKSAYDSIWVYEKDYDTHKTYSYRNIRWYKIVKMDILGNNLTSYKSIRDLSRKENINRNLIMKLLKNNDSFEHNNNIYKLY